MKISKNHFKSITTFCWMRNGIINSCYCSLLSANMNSKRESIRSIFLLLFSYKFRNRHSVFLYTLFVHRKNELSLFFCIPFLESIFSSKSIDIKRDVIPRFGFQNDILNFITQFVHQARECIVVRPM